MVAIKFGLSSFPSTKDLANWAIVGTLSSALTGTQIATWQILIELDRDSEPEEDDIPPGGVRLKVRSLISNEIVLDAHKKQRLAR